MATARPGLVRKESVLFCTTEEHDKNPSVYFCDTCNTHICPDCVTGKHRGHNFSSLAEVGVRIGNQISQTLEKIDSSILPHLESELEKVNDARRERIQHIEAIKATIADEYSKKLQLMDEEKKELFNHLDKQLKTDLEPLRRSGKNIQSALNKVTRFKDESQEGVSSGKTSMLLDLFSKAPDIEAYSTLKAAKGTFDYLDYVKSQSDKILGRFLTEEDYGSHIVGEPRREMQYETSVLSKYQTRFKKVESLCAVSPNSVWASYSKSDRLIKLQETNGDLRRKRHQRIREFYPADIRKVSDGLLISCLGLDYIYHLKKNEDQEPSEYRCVGFFPLGIYVNLLEEVFVCLLNEYSWYTEPESVRRVTKYSNVGHILMKIEFDRKGNRHFSLPQSVMENINSDICVIDVVGKHNGRLVVFTAEAEYRFEYSGLDSCDLSTCTHDSEGNIIISDEYNNRIHLVSMDGNFLGYITTAESNIYCPFAVEFDSPGKLWIGCKSTQTDENAQIVHLQYSERR